jgi:hypothetical protein
MSVETSKQPENTSSQLGRKIAEGKRKGESYREALSLQDVFSESQNASGSSLKTSCPHGGEAGLSDIGQGNGRNLKGKKNQNQSEIFLEAAENLS